eukprot:COSAG05_NODE_203_length_14207_cov_24.645379_5_plen_67_part_00
MRNCEIAAAKAAKSEPEMVNLPQPCVISKETLSNAQQGKIANDQEEKLRNGITNYEATKPLVSVVR